MDDVPKYYVFGRLTLAKALIFFIFSSNYVFAQADGYETDSIIPIKVPNTVLKGFQKKYPNIKPMFWLQEQDDYEVQFIHKGKTKTAEFNKKGAWVNSQTILEIQDLPEVGVDYIHKNFKNFEPNIVVLEETPLGTFYSVGVASEDDYQELIFDTKGNFLYVGEYVD